MSANLPVANKYDAMQLRAMNSEIVVYVNHGESNQNWKESIALWFAHFEDMCSRFQSTSFLAQFNQMPMKQPILVPELFYQVTYEAWELVKKTDFYFHPLVGGVMEAIGYTHSFRPDYECSTEVKELQQQTVVDDALIFYPHMKAIEKRTSNKLDLGGIGKGWSVEQAALWLKQDQGVSSGMVDGAGDLYCWSKGNEPWIIGIEDPYDQEQEIIKLQVVYGAVATSSTQFRRWQQGDIQRHHIINGKTGLPAESEIIQATVVGPSTTEAEVVAKVLCMLSIEEIPNWMENKFPHLGYVLVFKDGRLEISTNLTNRIVDRRGRV